ncbi:MAG: hypothetical protein ABR512_00945 [Desulfopila sp.]
MNKRYYSILGLLVVVFLAGGCAQKQWRDPLEENEQKSARKRITEHLEKRRSCTSSFDAEISATWESRIGDGGLNGYLKILLPSSVKVIALNPLGQALYAFATDGTTFQTINAGGQVYKYGKVASFVSKHSLPENLFHGEWAQWLTGSLHLKIEQSGTLLQDAASRGIWLVLELEESRAFTHEYLLFDTSGKRLLERVAIDEYGNESDRIIYEQWKTVDKCPVPTAMEIQGASYGATIQITLKNILIDRKFTKEQFALQPPSGYLRKFYP